MKINRTVSIFVTLGLVAAAVTTANAAPNTTPGVPQGKAIGYWTQT